MKRIRKVFQDRDRMTRGLILMNVVIYFLMRYTQVETNQDYLDWGANFGPLVWAGEYWRLFTSLFLHFNFLHILMNMLALYNLGPIIEMALGPFQMLSLYLVSGVAGSVMSAYWHQDALSLGASGAIFGLLGAFTSLILQKKLVSSAPGHNPLSSAFKTIALNIAISLIPGIDMSAHMGGLIAGFALAFIF
jgi:rhomboid protease GluP